VAPRFAPTKPGQQKKNGSDGVRKQLAQDGVSSKPMALTGSPVGVLIGSSQSYVGPLSSEAFTPYRTSMALTNGATWGTLL
jgi:hypothetical protein